MENGPRLSLLFDDIFNMENSRSSIDQLIRQMTMEAAGEVPPSVDTRQDFTNIFNEYWINFWCFMVTSNK